MSITFSDVLAVIFLIFGILNLLFPEISWKMQHFLSVKGGEPSTLYLIYARISGVILILLSLLIFFKAISFLGRM